MNQDRTAEMVCGLLVALLALAAFAYLAFGPVIGYSSQTASVRGAGTNGSSEEPVVRSESGTKSLLQAGGPKALAIPGALGLMALLSALAAVAHARWRNKARLVTEAVAVVPLGLGTLALSMNIGVVFLPAAGMAFMTLCLGFVEPSPATP